MSRSLPSFCRYRKKGPAGEAVEEMPGKLQKRGGEERARSNRSRAAPAAPFHSQAANKIKRENPQHSKNARPPYRWTGCFEGKKLQRERLLALPRPGIGQSHSGRRGCHFEKTACREKTFPAFQKAVLIPGGGLLKAVLVSRLSLSFYTLVRLRSSRVGPDGGGTPLSPAAAGDQGLRALGWAARWPGRAWRGLRPAEGGGYPSNNPLIRPWSAATIAVW